MKTNHVKDANDNNPVLSVDTPIIQTPQQPVTQIQYIVNQKSVEGVGGWLALYMVLFVIAGIGHIMMFFSAVSSTYNSDTLIGALISPLVAICAITAVVLIALRKKLGILVSLITVGMIAAYSIISMIIHSGDVEIGSPATPLAITIGTLLITVVVYGLFGLYFVVSKRVKQTLIK